MAITNHERVGKALDLLKDGLRPYVERELRARYGGNWANEVKAMLNDTRLGGSSAWRTNGCRGASSCYGPLVG